MPHRYSAFGLSIDSDIPLAGAQRYIGGNAGHAADIVISKGVSMVFGDVESLGPYQFDGMNLLFDMPAIARYVISARGKAIIVEASLQSSVEEVEPMLTATALPGALWMRSEVVLHAAGIRSPRKNFGIAITGPSGSGKSTWLQQLMNIDTQVAGDDMLCLRQQADGVYCSGLPAATFRRKVDSGEREMLEVPPNRQLREMKLNAIVVLGTPVQTYERPVRLHGSQALAALLRNLHRPRIPQLLGQTANLLPRVAKWLETVRVYSWKPIWSLQANALEDFLLRLSDDESD